MMKRFQRDEPGEASPSREHPVADTLGTVERVSLHHRKVDRARFPE
jgi:hypothetical protein